MNELIKQPDRSVRIPDRKGGMACRWWLVAGISLIAILVDLCVANRSGLWADELFSLAMATGHSLEHPAEAAEPKCGDFVEPSGPVGAEEFRRYLKHDDPPASPLRVIRATLLSDTSPPLYYLLLYLWTIVLGTSDMALRLFSMLCAVACLPLLVLIARDTAGNDAVLPACVLFVLSPLGIYYSTEGRMYSLLWLCVLAVIWLSLTLHQRGGGIAVHAMWVAASAAGFLTHYFFFFPWITIVVLLLARPGNFSYRSLVMSLSVTAFILLPWYVRLPESLHAWRITQGWLNWRPLGFNRARAGRELVFQFFSGGSELWISRRATRMAALLLFVIVGLATVWRLRTRIFGWRQLLVWLPFAGACAGPLVFDLVQHTYTAAVPRYAIAALPEACLMAAMGLVCLRPRARTVMLVLIMLSWAPGVWAVYRSRARNASPIRETAEAASANCQNSDLILIHSIPSGAIGIARYYTGPAPLASWVGQLGKRHVPEAIQKMAAGTTGIRLVKVHAVGQPAPEEDWLRANAAVINEREVGASTIVDFRPVNSNTF